MRQDSDINQVDVHREDFPSERNGFDEFLDTFSHEVEKLEETKEVSKKMAKQDNETEKQRSTRPGRRNDPCGTVETRIREPTRAIFYRSF